MTDLSTISKEDRKRFGISGKALTATRVLQKPMNKGDFNNQEAFALMVIDDVAGTITPMNTYNGNAGDNFRAVSRPLPAADSDRMRDYVGRGYAPGKVSDHPALKEIASKKAPAAVSSK